MDYIGSKEKLNKWIFNCLEKYFSKDNWKNLTFLDACSGTGSVSKYAIRAGFKNIISNDIMFFSYPLIKGYVSVSINNIDSIRKHINNINNLDGIEGFFFKNYSESNQRLYFTDYNAKRIDSTRCYICEKVKDERIKNYLLYCGIEAMSRVLNTTGVQAAFLKKFKARSINKYKLKMENYYDDVCNVQSYKDNIINLLSLNQCKEDILYIDPPYNNRQYGPNYHLYETFIRHDNPTIRGKTGLRTWEKESKSEFCSKRTSLSFLKRVIELSNAKLILISYSSDGLMNNKDIENLLLNFNNEFSQYIKKQIRYKSDNNRKNNDTVLKEYLYILQK